MLSIIAANNSGGGGGGLLSIGILLLIPVGMYFLLIRPQRRRQRAAQEMQSSLDVGDEVMTASGIYGFITGFEDDVVWVEIDDDVQIRVNRGFLQGKVPAGGGAPSGSAPAKAAGGTAGSAKVTPTVKGVKGDRAGKAEQASEPGEADADAERTTQE